MEAEDERAAEAQREKEAGNDAYRKLFLETAVLHYTRGAALDPRDISFLTNRAAAYLLMSKYKECVRDCDEAVEKGRELRADNRLLARALSRKASALLKLAACAGDYAPAIRALQQSLAEHYSEETRAKLDEAESARKEVEEQERQDQEAADHHRHKGNEFFQKKKYQEAADHYTEAIKKNPNDHRVRIWFTVIRLHIAYEGNFISLTEFIVPLEIEESLIKKEIFIIHDTIYDKDLSCAPGVLVQPVNRMVKIHENVFKNSENNSMHGHNIHLACHKVFCFRFKLQLEKQKKKTNHVGDVVNLNWAMN
ncbi:hypothetical protein ACQ4PT_033269 [Festuca glaucescens]